VCWTLPSPIDLFTKGTENVKKVAVIIMALLLSLTLTACDDDLDSRGGERYDIDRSNNADEVRDVDYVIMYRNVRRVPNIVISCTDGIAWASTTSGESGSSGRDIERAQEFDHECEGKEYEGQTDLSE
jgi:uncharacterized lipoprotein YehR (DUF1307 family)